MSTKYLFPCSCGQIEWIETTQAGQTISCSSCGQVRQIPTLGQIKNLEPAPEEEGKKKEETGALRRAFFLLGIVLLIPSLFCLSLFLYFLAYPLDYSPTRFYQYARVFHYPKPKYVSLKRVYFSYGQRTNLYQDSTPVPNFEHEVLWMRDEDFDRMSSIELFFYFQRLKEGPNFSYNFQENYQTLKDAYVIRTTTAAILFVLSISCLVASFFMPKRNVVVTGWSGTEWN